MKHKTTRPVDRALEEVTQQIETLERQLRAGGTTPSPSRVDSLKSFVKDLLTPPPKKPIATNRDLREVEVNPMADLEADALPFVRHHEPDLFAHATRQPAVAGGPADTLGKLLAAGSIRPPKPTLKRVQRETRNRFFMWLGLSFVALWLIYAVVR